jgi:hypothetical protein
MITLPPSPDYPPLRPTISIAGAVHFSLTLFSFSPSCFLMLYKHVIDCAQFVYEYLMMYNTNFRCLGSVTVS